MWGYQPAEISVTLYPISHYPISHCLQELSIGIGIAVSITTLISCQQTSVPTIPVAEE
jgi:hypothetical protein